MTAPALPPRLVEIADAIGEEAALTLCRTFGGERVEFPANPRPDHRVCRVVGVDAARRLGELYMGDRIDVPLAVDVVRWHDARRLRAEGMSIGEICRRVYASRSFVRGAVRGVVVTAPPAAPSGGSP
jgi:hypothetical protein